MGSRIAMMAAIASVLAVGDFSAGSAAPVLRPDAAGMARAVHSDSEPGTGGVILIQGRRGGGGQRGGGGNRNFQSNDFHRDVSNSRNTNVGANRNTNVNANRNTNVNVNRNVNVNGGCCNGNYDSGPNWGGVAAGVAVGAMVGAAASSAAQSTYAAPPPTYPPGYVAPPPY